jgi:response regulator RpfG family c-di-GMP phosphodiesterase
MSGEPNKILIVDDEPVIRELMMDILSEEGYSVEAAPDALEALELLKEDRDFVLLFTDIMMPKMDGIELIREARRINPTLIPIVMTGYATLESARAAVKEGAYDYVLKPFSLSEIKIAVANALERYQLTNENTRLLELTELFNISENVATFHDERTLLDYVLKAALNRVGAERGSIMLVSPDGTSLDVAASIGVPEEAQRDRVQIGNGISGWVAEHGTALIVEDIGKNPDLKEISRQLKDASFISVPLQRKLSSDGAAAEPSSNGNNGVLAVLNVNRKQSGGHFTEGDLKILSIVANHTAIALENVRLIEDVKDAHLATLKSMTLVLEAKDPYTHGHSERVRNYSVMAALKLGMNAVDVETLRLGAMLHDVGKIGVSDTILNSVEKLTDEEWNQIKLHPVIGYDVLKPVGFLTKAHLRLVRSHHERLDGSGYPDGLTGDELDDLVRIIAVADTYDAMSSNRAYRRGISPEVIVEELKRCGGITLDAKVSALFVDLIQSGEIDEFARSEPGSI